MSKKEQLLLLSPQNELVFTGNFIKGATKRLSLSNPTDKKIMYKIKTTAPKKYCVRPNGGTIDPKSTADIFIFLLPDVFEPSEMNKHKFMVQSIVSPDGEVEDVENLWKEISPDQIMGSKLRCVFDMAGKSDKSSDKEASASFISSETNNDSSEQPTNTQTDVKSNVESIRERHIDSKDELPSEIQSQLRQKHLELEEQFLRTSFQNSESSSKDKPLMGSSQSPPFQNTYSPPPVVNHQPGPVVFIGIAILMTIIGIILGKFIF